MVIDLHALPAVLDALPQLIDRLMDDLFIRAIVVAAVRGIVGAAVKPVLRALWRRLDRAMKRLLRIIEARRRGRG